MKRYLEILSIILLSTLLYSCRGGEGVEREVNIPRGAGASRVAGILAENSIIRSARGFSLYMRFSGSAESIKSGAYLLSEYSSYSSLRSRLTSGPNLYIRVSIPEGFTAEQIAARLYSRGIISDEEEFLQAVEERDLRGYLFPDTYDFFPGEGTERVLRKLLARFDAEFTEEYKRRAEEIGMSIREVVTLASIIEKEARVPEERPVISDVFHRRLRRNMRLESCATILFALGEHRSRLLYSDLQINSPYNTYRNSGLPPTPIANPGGDALRAALYPDPTEYLFFVARDDGSHIFSRTYREHLRNQESLRR